jgi:hypothetical protein
MVKDTSNQGGLRFHESEVQMGLSQSHLLPLPKSFQTAASSHTRRVLPGLRLQPQIRHPAAQRSNATKPKTKPKGRRPTYGLKVILSLTAIWEAAGYPCSARLKALLPLWLPWAQKRFAISAQAQKQLLSISPATIDRRLKPKKRQLKNRLYGRTKPGTLLKHSHPHQNRLLGCKNPGLYRNRSGLALGQLCFGGVHSLAQCYRHPLHLGRKPRRNGQKPDCCSQCHARD